jgi:subtilisin family serine protease
MLKPQFFILALMFFGLLDAQIPQMSNLNALSPTAKLLLMETENSALFPLKIDDKYPCMFKHKEESQIPKSIIYSKQGDIYTAWLSKTELIELSNTEGLAYIEAGGRLNAPKPLTDTTKVLTNTIDLHEGKGISPFLGKNTIVGIVDIGFEGSHPNFMNAEGSELRVKNWWHQNTTFAAPPSGFDYGSEFSKATDIQLIGDDGGSHGTHVAGIASGSGFTTPNRKYSGMAPEAEMAWVTIRYTNDSLDGSAYGDYVVANSTIIDGYKHIFDYATSVKKPSSVNLSWGMNTGPHDGTSLFDLAVESLVGEGKIIVGSSGNSANSRIHVQADLDSDTMYTWAYDTRRNNYDEEEVYCDFWGSPNQEFSLNVAIFDTLGKKVVESPFYLSTGGGTYRKMFINSLDTLTITVLPNGSYVGNDKGEILVLVKSTNAQKNRIRIGIAGIGTVHGWNSGQPYRWTTGSFTNAVRGNDHASNPRYLRGTREFSNGENGGTGRRTISVGSYVPRNSWIDIDTVLRREKVTIGETSGFSSIGPNVGGRTKPDISAPGSLVISSYKTENIAPWQNRSVLFKSNWNGDEHAWILASGTSMSAPHVCGIVALMLEANPRLNPEQIRTILQKTALKDEFTGSEDSNNIYGFGKVNAFGAVKEVIRVNTAKAVHPSDVMIFPNPADDEIIIKGMPNAEVELYDMRGKTVLKNNLNRFNTLDISDLKPGIYLIKASLNERLLQTKIIIE